MGGGAASRVDVAFSDVQELRELEDGGAAAARRTRRFEDAVVSEGVEDAACRVGRHVPLGAEVRAGEDGILEDEVERVEGVASVGQARYTTLGAVVQIENAPGSGGAVLSLRPHRFQEESAPAGLETPRGGTSPIGPGLRLACRPRWDEAGLVDGAAGRADPVRHSPELAGGAAPASRAPSGATRMSGLGAASSRPSYRATATDAGPIRGTIAAQSSRSSGGKFSGW